MEDNDATLKTVPLRRAHSSITRAVSVHFKSAQYHAVGVLIHSKTHQSLLIIRELDALTTQQAKAFERMRLEGKGRRDERGKKKEPLSREGYGAGGRQPGRPSFPVQPFALHSLRRLQGRRKQRERTKARLRCVPPQPQGDKIYMTTHPRNQNQIEKIVL